MCVCHRLSVRSHEYACVAAEEEMMVVGLWDATEWHSNDFYCPPKSPNEMTNSGSFCTQAHNLMMSRVAESEVSLRATNLRSKWKFSWLKRDCPCLSLSRKSKRYRDLISFYSQKIRHEREKEKAKLHWHSIRSSVQLRNIYWHPFW